MKTSHPSSPPDHRQDFDLYEWLKAHDAARDRLARRPDHRPAPPPPLRPPMDHAALAAGFHRNSKLRAILTGDPRLACEMIAVARQDSWTQFAAWLKAHGVTMNTSTSFAARRRLLAAVENIQRRNALRAALRAEARRPGTTLTGAALARAVTAFADIIETTQESPRDSITIRDLPLRAYIPGVGPGVFYRDL